jgi:hypothetical protein
MKCSTIVEKKLKDIAFKDDKALIHPKYLFRDLSAFVKTEDIYYDTTIDITLVKGISHPDYSGKTWLDILRNLKRRDRYTSINCSGDMPTIGYYTDKLYRKNSSKDPWGFDVIDGVAYVLEGNHRSVVAKFLNGAELIDKNQFGIDYVRYLTYDYKYLKLYTKLQKYINSLDFDYSEYFSYDVVSSQLGQEFFGVKKYKTTYQIRMGCIVDIYGSNSVTYKYDDFRDFRKEIFKIIKHINSKHKLKAFYLRLLAKYKNLISFSSK